MVSSTPPSTQAYAGPERRRNRVLVTSNSEYHCRDGCCVAVRDRQTGEFLRGHKAVGKRMTGGMYNQPGRGFAGVSAPEALLEGEQLCFSSCDGDLVHDVITSPLVAIERPPKDVVSRYEEPAKQNGSSNGRAA
jgi:hypothetical protein